MGPKELAAWLAARRACNGAIAWLARRPGLRDAYDACPDGSWLIWLGEALGLDRRPRVAAARAAATSAVACASLAGHATVVAALNAADVAAALDDQVDSAAGAKAAKAAAAAALAAVDVAGVNAFFAASRAAEAALGQNFKAAMVFLYAASAGVPADELLVIARAAVPYKALEAALAARAEEVA